MNDNEEPTPLWQRIAGAAIAALIGVAGIIAALEWLARNAQ